MWILKLTCLKASVSDAENISELQQNLIKRHTLEVNTLISSFCSLFNDINYLELLINTIKKLHHLKKVNSSLHESLNYIHSFQNADRAWKELFLYVMHNYYRIHALFTRDPVLKSDNSINLEDQMSEADKAQLNHFAMYAFALNFKHHVEQRAQKSLSEWTGTRTEYNAEQKDDLILMIYECYTSIKKKKKSGLSRKKFHKEYWEFLWLDNMQAVNDVTDDDITNFFIWKAVYWAFFDPWKSWSTDMSSEIRSWVYCAQACVKLRLCQDCQLI